MQGDENSCFALKDFIENRELVLFVHAGDRDRLVASNQASPKYKKKSLYFLKLEDGKLRPDLPIELQVPVCSCEWLQRW